VDTRSNVAQKMLDILPNYRTWSNKDLQSGTHRCLLGARLRASGYRNIQFNTDVSHLDLDSYTMLLARIITEQFPDRLRKVKVVETATKTVISFNDHVDTHFVDVRAVLEKTAAAWYERQEES